TRSEDEKLERLHHLDERRLRCHLTVRSALSPPANALQRGKEDVMLEHAQCVLLTQSEGQPTSFDQLLPLRHSLWAGRLVGKAIAPEIDKQKVGIDSVLLKEAQYRQPVRVLLVGAVPGIAAIHAEQSFRPV